MLNPSMKLVACLMLWMASNVQAVEWFSSLKDGNIATIVDPVICEQVNSCTANPIIDPAVDVASNFPNLVQDASCLAKLRASSPDPLDCQLLEAIIRPLEQLLTCLVAVNTQTKLLGGTSFPDSVVKLVCTIEPVC